MPTLNALKQERNELNEKFIKCMSDAESIRSKYDGKRTERHEEYKMTSDEEQRYDGLLDEADGLKSQIVRLDKEITLTEWAEKPREEERPGYGGETKSLKEQEADIARRKAYLKYLRAEGSRGDFERSEEFKTWERLRAEVKAYQADNPAGGGYAVMPEQMVNDFITLLKDLVYIRGLATVIPVTSADTLGAPALDTEPSDSDWTSELAVGSEETTAAVGKRELRPSPVAKYIKLSKTLVRKAPAFENLILDRLCYKMGITEEKAFLTGTGSNQPLGVFTASTQGISTARDVTAGAATVLAGDDFIEQYFGLKAAYRKRAVWIQSRPVIKAVRKLKDSNGDYLWTAGQGGQVGVITGPGGGLQGTPETLLGRPLYESENAPTSIATGQYVSILGDFKTGYWIADALGMEIQTLYELFAASNQMGYILRKETDGMPVLEEAFSRLKMA